MKTAEPESAPVALITGASGGIGMELARVHAAHGHDLVLVARREERLRELGEELGEAHGIRATVVPADLATAGGPENVYRRTQEAGIRVRYLVNNAGIGDFGPFAESDWQKQSDMIGINVTSLTRLTHLYLPDMVEAGRGRILNVASTAAFVPGPLMSVYYATKHYVLAFSESLYTELRGDGVTVTALCPGPTRSGFQSTAEMQESGLFDYQVVAGAREVAEYGFKQMMKGRPVAIHGWANKISMQAVRLSPRSVVRKMVHTMQKPRSQ
ncbi:MAG: SDR family oxidoreductase [Balneolaceae bacterium]|nr:SDR family oxidoreductase [Balneolaceae bacterium]